MIDVEYINKPKKAKDWEVGDNIEIFWTGFKTGEYEDEVLDRYYGLIREAEEKGDEEEVKELEADRDYYFSNVHITEDGEIEILLNGTFEIFSKDTRDDRSIIYGLIEGHGIDAQIRVSPEDFDRELLVLYNSTRKAEKYIKPEYRQKSKNELFREGFDIITKAEGKEIKDGKLE